MLPLQIQTATQGRGNALRKLQIELEHVGSSALVLRQEAHTFQSI